MVKEHVPTIRKWKIVQSYYQNQKIAFECFTPHSFSLLMRGLAQLSVLTILGPNKSLCENSILLKVQLDVFFKDLQDFETNTHNQISCFPVCGTIAQSLVAVVSQAFDM